MGFRDWAFGIGLSGSTHRESQKNASARSSATLQRAAPHVNIPLLTLSAAGWPCPSPRQDLAGSVAVLHHLPLQGCCGFEAAIRANKVNEFHLNFAAVEVAVEVEQERFEDGGAVIEGGAGAEVCGACIVAAPRGDTDGIDAVGQARAWGQGDVGGGKAQVRAALGAAAYHAYHAPPPAQHLGCSLDVTQPQLGADGP